MHYCCVKLCGKNTKTSGVQKDGISFHRFPKCPNMKEIWINATKRSDDWFPSPSSVVCSRHFKSEYLKLTKGNRRILYTNAVPTLHLPTVIHGDGSVAQSRNSFSDVAIVTQTLPTAEICHEATQHQSSVTMKMEVVPAVLPMPMTETIVQATTDFATNASYNIRPDQNTEDCLETISNFSSPRKKRLRITIADLSQKLKQSKIKVKRLQSSNRTYKKKITSLKLLLKELQDKQLVTDEHTSILEHIGVQSSEILKRQVINSKSGKISRTKYSPQLRTFALTLNFYSTKAYQYVRKTFNTCLPHTKTLSKWYQTVDGRPGFTKEAFIALKLKSEQLKQKLFGTLIFDEMKINNDDIDYNPQTERTYGYVDFGGELDTDCTDECSEALVFLVVPFNASFKLPIGYFLANKLNADQKATLITQAIRLCKEVNFEVKALTFDGCPTNTSTVKKLGCCLDHNNLKTTFKVDADEIVIFLDPVHMVKLLRNSFQFYSVLKDGQNNAIKWQHIQQLHELQESESFHMANKLRSAHMNFKKNVMKVKLATQIFSRSVATALDFCNRELNIKEFQDVNGTVQFLMNINDLFDILDSKTHSYGFKRAMNKENFLDVCRRMDEVKQYLLALSVHETSQKPEKNVKLIKSRRYTGFLGLCVCIESTKILFRKLIENEACPMTYLPLHKVSQDHIELFFCNVRSAGGCNDNPTPRQLEGIYKKMLIHTELQQSVTGNCIPLENISILNCSSLERINMTVERKKNNTKFNINDVDDEDELAIAVQEASLSMFAENIIEYISGFVARSLCKKIKCSKCVQGLISLNAKRNSLIFAKDVGGLIYPSEMVITICRRCEVIIKSNDNYKTIKPDRRAAFLVTKTLHSFTNEDLFPDLSRHQFDYESTNHVIDLTKLVIEKYISVRLAYLTKKKQTSQNQIRRVFTKLIHFKGQ